MAYSSHSNLITNAPIWRPPVSENTLMQGNMLAEQNLQSSKADIQGKIDNIFNIKGISEADEQVIQQKQQELKDVLKNVNISNLSNPQTKNQINSIISQFSTDPDVLAVATRSAQVNKELQTKKDYEAKGKQYVSPLLRQAEKYIGDGNYYRDTRFNKTGFVAPDNKELDEIAKNTPEWQNIVTTGGYDITQKGKAEGALANNYYAHFTTNPKWNSLLNDQFEQNLEGVDIQDIHSKGLDGVKQLFPHLPVEAQQRALADIEEGYQLQQTNPYIGDAWKNKLKEDFFQNQAYMAAQAKTYVNTVDKKQNAYTKDAIDFQQAKQLEVYKAIVPGALALGVSPEAIISGKAKDADGNIITVDKAMQKAQDFKVAEAQARQDIKTEAAKTVDDYRTANKIEYAEATGKKLDVALKGGKEIKFGDKFIDKQSLMSSIGGGNEEAIKQYLEENKGKFGMDYEIDQSSWYDTTFKIKDGEVIFETNNPFKDDVFKIKLSEIAKTVGDPYYIPYVDKNGEPALGNKANVGVSNVETTYNDEIDTEALNAFVNSVLGGDNTKITQEQIEALKRKYPKKK